MKPVLPESVINATITESLRIWDAMKADGASQAERVAVLEKTLRVTLPQVRVWKYLCDRCDDTGLEVLTCRVGARCPGMSTRMDQPGQRPGKYRRQCAVHPLSEYTHEYGRSCTCAAGARFQPKVAEDFTQEAGTTARRKPTRFGR